VCCSSVQDQQTALILAARCNHDECVKVLLEAGADVNAEDVVSISDNSLAVHVSDSL
jgi:ankyrin repeat protein